MHSGSVTIARGDAEHEILERLHVESMPVCGESVRFSTGSPATSVTEWCRRWKLWISGTKRTTAVVWRSAVQHFADAVLGAQRQRDPDLVGGIFERAIVGDAIDAAQDRKAVERRPAAHDVVVEAPDAEAAPRRGLEPRRDLAPVRDPRRR